MNSIFIRSLSGTVYIAIIIGSLLLGKSVFAFVCLLLNVLGTLELYRFNSTYKKTDIINIVPGIAAFSMFHLYFIGLVEPKWLFLLLLFPLVLLTVELYKKQNNAFFNITFSLLGIAYITIPLIILNYLNTLSTANYSKIVMVVFLLIWINDTFAYLSGMMFGKHKLFERMTPKKTWEGFIGGVISTLFASWLLFNFSEFSSLKAWLVLSFLVAISSVFGDFVESMFKRNAGVKDSGNIMPGHGGVLDRIDSLLFVFPVVFIYISVLS